MFFIYLVSKNNSKFITFKNSNVLKKNGNIDESNASFINIKRRKKRKYREEHKDLKQMKIQKK